MSYTPPDSKLVALTFTGAYTPPDSRMVGINLIPPPTGNTQIVYPDSFNATAFGNSAVSQTPAVAPTGFSVLTFGALDVTNRAQGITPAGHDAVEFGVPSRVWNFHTFVRAESLGEGTTWGTCWISNWVRYIGAIGAQAAQFGDTEITLQHRPIYPNGSDLTLFGDAAARLAYRRVYLAGVKFSAVSEVDFQLKTRYLLPPGVNTATLGTLGIRYLNTVVAPTGIAPPILTSVKVGERTQRAFPPSVQGVPAVMPVTMTNRNRFVTPTTYDHLTFSSFWPAVVNRNREVSVGGLVPPAPSALLSVRNAAYAIAPPGILATQFGVSNTTNQYQYRQLQSFNTSRYGTPYVALVHIVAHPAGQLTERMGEPEVSRRVRTIWPDGVEIPYSDSEPWVSHAVRQIRIGAGPAPLPVSTPVITRDTQYFGAGGIAASVFGGTVVSLAYRTVSPEGIFFQTPAAAFGMLRLYGLRQYIRPQPFPTEGYGAIAVSRNERYVSAGAGLQTVFGEAKADLWRKYFRVRSAYASEIFSTTHNFWNRRQYVLVDMREPMGVVLGTPRAALRNRTISPTGNTLTKFSNTTLVLNKARALYPAGTTTTLYGDTLVAPRIRTIAPQGYALSPYFGQYLNVHNLRQVLLIGGIRAPWTGVPDVRRNERRIGTLQGIPAPASVSAPMVAFRIRTITPRDIQQPQIGNHRVSLLIQRVLVPGVSHTAFGSRLLVYEFFNIARPTSWYRPRFGAPSVWNKTPMLRLGGLAPEENQQGPWVSNRTRTITPTEVIPTYNGGPVAVEFRTRLVVTGNIDALRFPITHRIERDEPPLPGEQLILPVGIGVPEVPSIAIRGQVLFIDGWDSLKFGSADVTGMSIWPKSNLCDFNQRGDPTVTHKNRTINIDSDRQGVPQPSNVTIFPARIIIDFLIYPNPLMDSALADSDDPLRRPFFGTPTVSNQYRSIQLEGAYFGGVGMPEIHTNYLYFEGWDSNEGRWGLTDFAGPIYVSPYWGRSTEDYIPEVPAYNFDTTKYGEPGVAHPVIPPVWSPYVTPSSAYQTNFGQTKVELLNRQIYPDGYRVPADQQVPTPWLHPPFHLWPEGSDMSILPQPMVAFRIRKVYPEGDNFEAVCLEEAGTIASRMRVRHGKHLCPVDGWASDVTGTPLVAERVRTLRPEGFTHARVRVAHVDGVTTTRQTGWDSLVFGNVRRANPGEIVTGWFSSLVTGYVRLNRSAPVSGIAAPTMSSPRISHPFRAAGFDRLQAGRVAVTNPYGCRDRVIIVGAGSDFSTFGVTHATQ
jgi:hypothetical protein